MPRAFSGTKMSKLGLEKTDKVFSGNKTAKPGTEKNPARVSVQTEKRSEEVKAQFEEHGWHHTIELNPDKPEDIAELERLLNPPQPNISDKKVGRNDPCPCGSRKKYKKCCGK
jgi:SWIM/SEC-C metal-binding protein